MSGTDSTNLDCELGEEITAHPERDGAVVSRVSDIEPGEATQSVTVDRDELLDEVSTRLPDDYPTVYCWCDGSRIVVTDHKKPADPDAGQTLQNIDDVVHRADAVQPHTGANCTLVARERLQTAIEAVDADEVQVHVESSHPVIVEDGGEGAATAPCIRPDVGAGGGDSA